MASERDPGNPISLDEQKARMTNEGGPAAQNSERMSRSSHYAEGAPDSSRKWGEAGSRGSQDDDSSARPMLNTDRDDSEVPFAGEHRQTTQDPKLTSGSQSGGRQPARGSGVPPKSGAEHELIEAPTTPINEKMGRIETGATSAPGDPDQGSNETPTR